ncbi:MAG: DUF882 domain-containing protein [Alphaproteobacteria bacterium]|nr:DUF882 domain-containing protein [Alphaproteobacteria bacterium]
MIGSLAAGATFRRPRRTVGRLLALALTAVAVLVMGAPIAPDGQAVAGYSKQKAKSSGTYRSRKRRAYKSKRKYRRTARRSYKKSRKRRSYRKHRGKKRRYVRSKRRYAGSKRRYRKSAKYRKYKGYRKTKRRNYKKKHTRVAALNHTYRRKKARKSLSGGGVRWVASSGCLNGRLKSVVYQVAAKFGPVTVSSTCRSRSRNRRVGGAKKSWHLKGAAVDFRVHANYRAAYAYLKSHGSIGGYKHYGGGLFHIDVGPRRTW